MNGTSRNHRRRRRLAAALTLVVVVLVAGGLYWFQPWRLLTDKVVDERLPVLAAEIVPASASTTTSSTAARPTASSLAPPTTATTAPPATASTVPSIQKPAAAPTKSSAPEAVLLAAGTLISHEHETSGAVELIRLADGDRALALKGLRTSDGPALHVWLTDAPVLPGSAGWHVFDDGRYLDLGDLKGNIGNQLYPIPDDVELASYSSVTIWCERFSVSFGAAALTAP